MGIMLTLDVQEEDRAAFILRECIDDLSYVKIGHVILSSLGLELTRRLCDNIPIFLDLKFHDIPNTVEKSILGYTKWFPKVGFFTVHGTAHEDVLKVAINTSDATPLSVITLSSDDIDIDNSLKVVEKNLSAGIRSFICPPYLIKTMRYQFGEDVILVTPGIRNGITSDDHKETLTASEAYAQGVNYIVVGRPILNSNNPKQTIKEYKI